MNRLERINQLEREYLSRRLQIQNLYRIKQGDIIEQLKKEQNSFSNRHDGWIQGFLILAYVFALGCWGYLIGEVIKYVQN